jgi:hypothetical protein
MVTSARRMQEGYARDLAAFLNFLWLARGQRSWRDAGEADRLAYLHWRRRDCAGPQVAESTFIRSIRRALPASPCSQRCAAGSFSGLRWKFAWG